MGFLDSLTNITPAEVNVAPPPQTNVVDWFHKRASTNRDEDLHHPLGNDSSSASFGDHDHEGKRGNFLWELIDVPADLGASPTTAQIRDAVNSILALLRVKSG